MMLDDTLQILSEEHRRQIMYIMEEKENEVFDYEDLAEEMIDQGHLRDEERERFQTQMSHAHLPKMEESGLVEYDPQSGTVHYVQDEDVEKLLEFVEEYEN